MKDWFGKPGLLVNKCLYDGGLTDPVNYGYRLGSMMEVHMLGLHKSFGGRLSRVEKVSFSDGLVSTLHRGIWK